MDEHNACVKNIAVVDDNPAVLSNLSEILRVNGFKPFPMSCSREFAALNTKSKLDLAIIDLHLAGESGLDLVQTIRAKAEIPIIMVTGIGDDVDRIIGLEAGADDYLTKPLNTRELIARIRAVLRRYNKLGSEETSKPAGIKQVGEFSIATDQRRLFDRNGEEIMLTNSEFRLLEYFLGNPNRIIDRVELLKHLGSDCSEYVDRSIDVLILRLRRKIEISPSKPIHLQTRRGKGYVFVQEAEEAVN